MKPKLDTILFDMDNNLVDMNMNYMYKVLKGTFKAVEKEFDYNLADEFWFNSNRSTFASRNLGVSDKRFFKEFGKRDKPQARCKNTKPFYDIDFIDDLRAEGYKTGIVTSAPEYIGEPVVRKIGENRFDVVVYANAMHGIKHKPDPQGLEIALEKLDSKPKNSAYVGDTPGDMLAAKAAKVYPIFTDRKTHFLKHDVDVPLKVSGFYPIGHFLGMKGY